MNKENKIFITGGAGYIGSTLIPILLKKGFKVTVLDSLIFNQSSILDCCINPNFEFIQGDICDYKIVNELISNAHIVIPLAAIVVAPACRCIIPASQPELIPKLFFKDLVNAA